MLSVSGSTTKFQRTRLFVELCDSVNVRQTETDRCSYSGENKDFLQ